MCSSACARRSEAAHAGLLQSMSCSFIRYLRSLPLFTAWFAIKVSGTIRELWQSICRSPPRIISTSFRQWCNIAVGVARQRSRQRGYGPSIEEGQKTETVRKRIGECNDGVLQCRMVIPALGSHTFKTPASRNHKTSGATMVCHQEVLAELRHCT